jgi:hypothetical protein
MSVTDLQELVVGTVPVFYLDEEISVGLYSNFGHLKPGSIAPLAETRLTAAQSNDACDGPGEPGESFTVIYHEMGQ